MLIIPPPPFDVISIGLLHLHVYGIVLTIAIVISYFVTKKRLRLYGVSREMLDSLILPVLLAGIIGARLYHIVDAWSYYQNNLLEIFAIWRGGLAIYGALIGGLITLIVYAKRMQLQLLTFLDCIIPGVLLGQAIGRLGNYFNQEAFGPPTQAFIGLAVDFSHRPMYWLEYPYFQPLFLYESLWSFIGVGILLLVSKRLISRTGRLLGLYLIIYGSGRLLIEQMRFDTAQVFGLKIASILSFLFILLGLYFLFRSRRSSSSDNKMDKE